VVRDWTVVNRFDGLTLPWPAVGLAKVATLKRRNPRNPEYEIFYRFDRKPLDLSEFTSLACHRFGAARAHSQAAFH
jgi:hypothetical protein